MAKSIMITPYRLPKRLKDEIETTIKELLVMGHIRASKSPFSSLVVLVKKKDGILRMCIDYRLLNRVPYSRNIIFSSSNYLTFPYQKVLEFYL